MTDVRSRLVKALHTSSSLPQLREELVLVLCDLEEESRPTLRSIYQAQRTQADADEAPETQPDSAPPTPVDSAVGQEFGP